MRWVPASVALALTLGAPVPLLAQCAEGCLHCLPCSANPVQACSLPEAHGQGASSANLDMRHGALEARGQAYNWAAGGAARINDEFMVTGSAPGVPVELVARLRILTSGPTQSIDNANIHYFASLREGTSPPVEFHRYPRDSDDFPAQTFFDSTLTVTVTVLPSQSFRIGAYVSLSALHYEVAITGDVDFTGLPPEARITSCGGFLQGAPVPALPTSWGLVKTRYR